MPLGLSSFSTFEIADKQFVSILVELCTHVRSIFREISMTYVSHFARITLPRYLLTRPNRGNPVYIDA